MQSIHSVSLSEQGAHMRADHASMAETAFQAATNELHDIVDAYRIAIEIISSAASRTMDSYRRANTGISRIEGILSGFIVGLTIVEYAIVNGFTAQAAALVRQELEAVAALEEIKVERRVDGKTPNVRHLLEIPGRVYSDLSDLTHFSRPSALKLVTRYGGEDPDAPEYAEQWLLSPQHVPNTTRQLFALHTLLLLHFAQHQASHYASLESPGSSVIHSPEFQQAIDILERAGVIAGSKNERLR